MRQLAIKELDIEVTGGQIMSRITVDKASKDEAVELRRVIIPKSIGADGSIDEKELAEEALRTEPDSAKITSVGDIVLKLSSPYNAAMADEASSNCIVPSFCALIRNNSELNDEYLLAFLNSDTCKKQLAASVAGGRLGFVSVGKVRNVLIPIPDTETQKSIGQSFVDAQKRIKIIKRIMELESKKNDIIIRDLTKEKKICQ